MMGGAKDKDTFTAKLIGGKKILRSRRDAHIPVMSILLYAQAAAGPEYA
jgi:hypothetical protein